MFQFRRFPTYTYFIQCTLTKLHLVGLPHSDICGSMSAYDSPQLFVVNHVLLRLPVPRHSPCALSSLTYLFFWFHFFFENYLSVVSLVEILYYYPISCLWNFKTDFHKHFFISSHLAFFSLFSFQGTISG